MKKNYYVQLNIQDDFDKHIGVVKLNETDSCVLNINLVQNGKPFDLSEATYVTLTIIKPDTTLNNGYCDIADGSTGKVSYTLPTNCVNQTGVFRGEIQAFNNTSMISTAAFSYEVKNSLLHDEGVTSQPEYPILVALIGQVNGFVSAEATRVSNENTRKSNETARVSSESGRVTSEVTRVSNETARVSSETARLSAESIRLSSESSRISAENDRLSSELVRKNSEILRANAESDRLLAEPMRITAENQRIANEVVRVSNESVRVSNESVRVTEFQAILDAWENIQQADVTAEVVTARSSSGLNKTYQTIDGRFEFIEQTAVTNTENIEAIQNKITLGNIPYVGVTTNNGNIYTITSDEIGTLVEGLPFSFKLNADATNSMSLIVNGAVALPLLKQNGSAMKTGKANSIYTVRVGTGNFQLQGEGGDYGTGTAAEMLAGYTLGTENGVENGTLALTGDSATANVLSGKTFYNTNAKVKQTGSMPNRSGDTVALSSVVSGTTLKLLASNGYRNGTTDYVTKTEPNLTPLNVADGVNLFGVTGRKGGLYVGDVVIKTLSLNLASNVGYDSGAFRTKKAGTVRIKFSCTSISGSVTGIELRKNGTVVANLLAVGSKSYDMALSIGDYFYILVISNGTFVGSYSICAEEDTTIIYQ